MEYLFFISATTFLCILIYTYKRNRKLITVPNIVFVSTVLNFILYLQNWSLCFSVKCSDATYYVMFVVSMLFSIYALLYKEKKERYVYYLKPLRLRSIRFRVSTFLLSICILFIAIENYYYSGSVFAVDKISNHTANMPGIGTLLKGLYPVAYICAYNDWKTYRCNGSLIFALLCFLYGLLGLGSRYWAAVSILTFCFYLLCNESYILSNLTYKLKMFGIALAIGILKLFIYLGNLRVAEGFSYGYSIQYIGPLNDGIFSDLASWYYGYFPYSFYNLNCTLINIENNDIFTMGSFMLYPYLAFFHLQHFFNFYLDNLTYNVRVFDNPAASIATGWFEFYADFRELFFIGVFVYILITIIFNNINNFFGKVSYASMLSVWSLMSFLNTYTLGIILYTFLIAYLIQIFFVYKKE